MYNSIQCNSLPELGSMYGQWVVSVEEIIIQQISRLNVHNTDKRHARHS